MVGRQVHLLCVYMCVVWWSVWLDQDTTYPCLISPLSLSLSLSLTCLFRSSWIRVMVIFFLPMSTTATHVSNTAYHTWSQNKSRIGYHKPTQWLHHSPVEKINTHNYTVSKPNPLNIQCHILEQAMIVYSCRIALVCTYMYVCVYESMPP